MIFLDKLTFPGFMICFGSIASFTRFMRCTVPAPNSSTRYSFLPTPTPCSPVPSFTRKLLSHKERESAGTNLTLTCAIHCDCAMDEAVYALTHFFELFVVVKEDESVEVALGTNWSDTYEYAI